jgi:nitrite reductase/ring-hydroxylating ferredoxin subunit
MMTGTGFPLRCADDLQSLPDGVVARFESQDATCPPLCVARVGDGFCGVPDICPHGGVRLSDGTLEGSAVRCPVHGLRFDMRTGKAADHDFNLARLPAYSIWLDGDRVQAEPRSRLRRLALRLTGGHCHAESSSRTLT